MLIFCLHYQRFTAEKTPAIRTMGTSFTLYFQAAPKGELILLRNYLRLYHRNRLRGTDAVAPRVWQDRRLIILEAWERGALDEGLTYAFQKLGAGHRLPRPEIRASTTEESATSIAEAASPPAAVDDSATEAIRSHAFRATPTPYAEAGRRAGKYTLLVSGPVLEALSSVPGPLVDPSASHLRDLILGTWESWASGVDGFQCWTDGSIDRTMFTSSLPGVGTLVWERVQTVDLLQSLSYPANAIESGAGGPFRLGPHVVIYELREGDGDHHETLSFQGVLYHQSPGLNATDQFNPPPEEDQLTYEDELYILALPRIRDVLTGVQRGLPLHLSVEQVGPLNAPGPVLLGGEAGSGKSSVIVQWLVINHLQHEQGRGANEPSLRQLFVTYSERLRDKAETEFTRMLPRDKTEHLTSFKTYAQLLQDIAEKAGLTKRFDPALEVTFESFVATYGQKLGSNLDPFLLWDEIRSTVKGASTGEVEKLIDRATYQGLNDRKGRCKVPPNLRDTYYDAALSYQAYLRSAGKWDFLDLVQACISKTELMGGFDRIACDEAQDLAPAEVHLLIRLLGERSPSGLFITGDVAQVINPSGFQWSKLKGDLGEVVPGRNVPEVIFFRRNYRSTADIVELVNRVLVVRKRILDDDVSKLDQNALIPGKIRPLLLSENPLPALIRKVANPEKRLILVKTQAEKEKVRRALGANAPAHSILTTEEAKGLEWDGVLLYNFFQPRHEMITKNDWKLVFDPHQRDRLPEQIQSGVLNPYGLTYEFNMLHVGLTRARRILAVFDEDPLLNLANLGPEVAPSLMPASLEAFHAHWESAPASADELQSLGEKLLERDSNQARTFLRLAGERFQEHEDLVTAAACFERAEEFERAAVCFEALRNVPETLRLRSMKAQADGNTQKAAEFQMERGRVLGKAGAGRAASDAYYEARRLREFAGDSAGAAEAAYLRAEALPFDAKSERARCFSDAAGLQEQMGALDQARASLEKAIREGESCRTGMETQIEGERVSAWIASREGQLSELYVRGGSWGKAALSARRAAGLFKSASDADPSQFSRGRYAEASNNWFAKAVERYIAAREVSASHGTRQELLRYISGSPDLKWARQSWTSFIDGYRQIPDFDEAAASAVELAELLGEHRQAPQALEILKSTLTVSQAGGAGRAYLYLLDSGIEVLSRVADRPMVAELLELRAAEYVSAGDFEKAFEDFKNAGSRLVDRDLPSARRDFDAACKSAAHFLRPPRIGRFCVVDLILGALARSTDSKEKLYWADQAAVYFAQDAEGSEEELKSLRQRFSAPDGVANRAWVETVGFLFERSKRESSGRSLDDNELKGLWSDLCERLHAAKHDDVVEMLRARYHLSIFSEI